MMAGRWIELRDLGITERCPSQEASGVLVDEMSLQRACQVVPIPGVKMRARINETRVPDGR
jgi:hypothetical protein